MVSGGSNASSAPLVVATCPHPAARLDEIESKVEDMKKISKILKCNRCTAVDTHVWVCAKPGCHFIGCGRTKENHFEGHFQRVGGQGHSVMWSVGTGTLYCHACAMQVSDQPKEESTAQVAKNETGSLLTIEEDTAKRGRTGLSNLGNTCYMNAALQAMLNCEPLVAYLSDCYDFVRTSHSVVHPLPEAFHDLTQQYWDSGVSRALAPRWLWSEVQRTNPTFRGYAQQDAQEFLTFLLDKLHEEMSTITPVPHGDAPSRPHRHFPTSTPNPSVPSTPRNLSAVDLSQLKIHDTTEEEERKEGNNEEEVDATGKENGDTGGGGGEKKKKKKKKKKKGDKETVEDVSAVAQNETNPKEGAEAHINNIENGERNEGGNEEEAGGRPPWVSDEGPLKHSVINDLFEGVMRSQVVCLSCGRDSLTYDRFFSLSVPVCAPNESEDGPVSLWGAMKDWFRSWGVSGSLGVGSCLESFCSEERLSRENHYKCGQCHKTTQCTKAIRIHSLPEVLVLHLKRFRYDTYFGSKVSTPVTFPLNSLDMAPYTVDPQNGEGTRYQLTALVNHRGGLGGGHYVGYARSFVHGRWYEYDDSSVREVTAKEVQGTEAYVLVYQRDQGGARAVRQRLWVMMEADTAKQYFVSRQWMWRLLTLTQPGPITNSDICCPHGGVRPHIGKHIASMVVGVSAPVWRQLVATFGGGPELTVLSSCVQCERRYIKLLQRREVEKASVKRLNATTAASEKDCWYLLPVRWHKQWTRFVESIEEDHFPPGPIDTTVLLQKDGEPRTNLRNNVHYRLFHPSAWAFLAQRYGVKGPVLEI